jgi:hypothetical protein
MEKNILPTTESKIRSNVVIDRDIVILIHRRPARIKILAIGFTVVAFLYLCFNISRPLLFNARTFYTEQSPSLWEPLVETSNTLVPLEAHIMSKCPDAKVRSGTPPCADPQRLILVDMSERVGTPYDATSIR